MGQQKPVDPIPFLVMRFRHTEQTLGWCWSSPPYVYKYQGFTKPQLVRVGLFGIVPLYLFCICILLFYLALDI